VTHIGQIDLPTHTTSKLVLSDRLLTLAQDAERGGYLTTADRLVRMAFAVLEETPVGH
jgi:hypothetical protein